MTQWLKLIKVVSIIIGVLFLTVSSVDFYNTLNTRAFLDMFYGHVNNNPNNQELTFGDFSWKLDWPYPPLTILLTLVPWYIYKLFPNEQVYQLLFKLPFILTAIGTGILLYKWKSKSAASLYILNPGTILLTIIWASFDVITGLLLLVTFLYIHKKPYLSILSLTISICLRLYPAIITPLVLAEVFRNKKVRILPLVVSILIPVFISVLLYFSGNYTIMTDSLLSQHTNYGPLGSYVFVYGIKSISEYYGIPINENFLLLILMIVTLCAMIKVYTDYFLKKSTFGNSIVLANLLFFALYPKMHAPYIFALLPLMLVINQKSSQKNNLSVFFPSILYAIFVNGKGDIRGIFYWFYWAIGNVYKTPEMFVLLLTLLITIAYEILIIRRITGMLSTKKSSKW